MARQWIRHACAKLHLRRIERHRRHVDVGFAPDEMRVADPDMREAQLFADFGEMNHFLQRFRRK